jgi:acetyl esterase/lipase
MKASRWAGPAYLAASGVAALNTLNAYRPLAWSGRGSIASFFAGFPTTEIPLGSVGISAAQAGLAAGLGAARTRTGRVGLALSAASAAALVGLQVRARPAPQIVQTALTEALGDGYESRIAHPERPDSETPLRPQPGVVRTLMANKRYAHDSDISYGPAGRRNHLDIWRRPDLPADGKAPVLVQVHGGAWIYGNKLGQAYPLMAHLVERGWICVSVNYRLSPRSTWPDHIVDVKRAVAWVKQHISEYGGDPDFVAITGGSAGGHLSALHALTAQDRLWQPGFEDVDTTVVAAVPFYGVYDWTNRDGNPDDDVIPMLEKEVVKTSFTEHREVFDEASPMSHVRADAPPFFALHGTNDTLVPVAQARAFVRRLRAVSNEPVAYAEFPGAQHAFDIFSSIRANASAAAVARFLGVVYGDHQRRLAQPAAGAPVIDLRTGDRIPA